MRRPLVDQVRSGGWRWQRQATFVQVFTDDEGNGEHSDIYLYNSVSSDGSGSIAI